MTLENISQSQEESALVRLTQLEPRMVDFLYRRTLPAPKTAALLQSLEHRLQSETGSVVFFAGATAPGDTLNVAFETAYAAALQRETPVLFINFSSDTTNEALLALQKEKVPTLDTFLKSRDLKQSPFLLLQGHGLFYTHLREAGQNLQTQTLKKLLNALRSQFGLIIVYSDSALTDGSAVSFARHADGTVIVAKAEHTRGPVAKELKNVLEDQKCRIIGAVLTGRRFYIPKMLYRFLYKAQ